MRRYYIYPTALRASPATVPAQRLEGSVAQRLKEATWLRLRAVGKTMEICNQKSYKMMLKSSKKGP